MDENRTGISFTSLPVLFIYILQSNSTSRDAKVLVDHNNQLFLKFYLLFFSFATLNLPAHHLKEGHHILVFKYKSEFQHTLNIDSAL